MTHLKNQKLIFLTLVILLISLSSLIFSNVFATTQGPASPNTVSNVATIGTVQWINPTNIASSNNQYTTATLTPTNTNSNYLIAKNFGFTIPPNSTIDGILVEVERKASVANRIQDSSVKLVKDGTNTVGSDKAKSTPNWAVADLSVSYGSTSDLWGTIWTASEINNNNFGIAFAAKRVSGNAIAQIDNIRITIAYTVPVTTPSAPTGLSATPDDTQVSLSWTAPSNGGSAITDYLIEYRTGTDPFTTFSHGRSTSTSATVTGLTNGVSYEFRVSAINSVGTSTPSNTVSATPIASVTTPSAPELSATPDERVALPATETNEISDNLPPKIEGIGFYKIRFSDKTNVITETKINNFQDYFPYAISSNEFDLQNYGTIGPYKKEGFYISTKETKTSSPTFYSQTDEQLQIQVRLKDDKNSKEIQTVVLYMNIRAGLSAEFSDTYIVFDNTQEPIVIDPHDFLKDVKTEKSIENGEYWAIFALNFAKPMQKSDIIIEAWDRQKDTVMTKIIDALEINQPAISLPQSKITILHGEAYVGCKETDSCFSPSNLEVIEGSTVTWHNADDDFIHTITSGTPYDDLGKKFRGVLLPNESFDYTFCCEGVYKYYCEIHPWATGIVTVNGDDPHINESFTITAYVPSGSVTIQNTQVFEKTDLLNRLEISGKINSEFEESTIISITKPDEQTSIRSVKTDNKGRFSTSIVLDKTFESGVYNVSVIHGDHIIETVSFTIF